MRAPASKWWLPNKPCDYCTLLIRTNPHRGSAPRATGFGQGPNPRTASSRHLWVRTLSERFSHRRSIGDEDWYESGRPLPAGCMRHLTSPGSGPCRARMQGHAPPPFRSRQPPRLPRGQQIPGLTRLRGIVPWHPSLLRKPGIWTDVAQGHDDQSRLPSLGMPDSQSSHRCDRR